MKKIKGHIEGNFIFQSGVDYSELTSIGGAADFENATVPDGAFPQLTSIGGYAVFRGATVPDGAFPQLTSIGGYAVFRGATVPDGAFPQLTSIGGAAVFNGATVPDGAFPQLTSIGGYAYFNGATVPDRLRKIKTNDIDCPAKTIAQDGLIKSFLKSGFLFADGILSKYVSKRLSKQSTLWKVIVCGKVEFSYVIEKDGVFSHGKTLAEAKASLIFKIAGRDTSWYESWNLDTVVSAAEAIGSYRAITGACEFGVRDFCEKNGADLNGKYSVQQIIDITDGAYGNKQYKQFFETQRQQN